MRYATPLAILSLAGIVLGQAEQAIISSAVDGLSDDVQQSTNGFDAENGFGDSTTLSTTTLTSSEFDDIKTTSSSTAASSAIETKKVPTKTVVGGGNVTSPGIAEKSENGGAYLFDSPNPYNFAFGGVLATIGALLL